MRIVTTTQARSSLADIVDYVKFKNCPVGIGRRNKVEVLLVKYPEQLNTAVNDITNANHAFGSFDFLESEPDLYTADDINKANV